MTVPKSVYTYCPGCAEGINHCACRTYGADIVHPETVTVPRISKDLVYVQMTLGLAQLATCKRLQVGALLIGSNGRILSGGYNGSPPGQPHCLDIGCEMLEGHCIRTIHAEVNALAYANGDTGGSTLYLNYVPCINCTQAIVAHRVSEVVFWKDYRDMSEQVGEYLGRNNIKLRKLDA